MIKFIVKQFIYGRFYLWLKPRMFGLVIIFVGVFLVLYIHNEYLNYIAIEKTNNNKAVGISFIIKNLLLFFLVLGYIIFQYLLFRTKKNIETIEFNKPKKIQKDIVYSLDYFLSNEEINNKRQ
jgi:hypothetical protein